MEPAVWLPDAGDAWLYKLWVGNLGSRGFGVIGEGFERDAGEVPLVDDKGGGAVLALSGATEVACESVEYVTVELGWELPEAARAVAFCFVAAAEYWSE